MDAVENFTRKWVKKDKFDISVLHDWISEIKYIVSGKIKTLQKRTKQPLHPVFTNPKVVSCLQDMLDKYVFASANKAPSKVIIIGNSLLPPCSTCSQTLPNGIKIPNLEQQTPNPPKHFLIEMVKTDINSVIILK